MVSGGVNTSGGILNKHDTSLLSTLNFTEKTSGDSWEDHPRTCKWLGSPPFIRRAHGHLEGSPQPDR